MDLPGNPAVIAARSLAKERMDFYHRMMASSDNEPPAKETYSHDPSPKCPSGGTYRRYFPQNEDGSWLMTCDACGASFETRTE